MNTKLFLSNHAGSFCLLGTETKSKYEGLFFLLDGKMYKTIADFDMKKKPKAMVDELWRTIRKRNGILEHLWFAPEQPVFFYELSKETEFDLILDFKENYDNREWGRSYEIEKNDKMIVIRYNKKNDNREQKGKEYELWMAIFSPKIEYKDINKWEQKKYPEDKERNSPPYTRWVYRAGTIKAKKTAISCAKTKEEAIKTVLNAWIQKDKLAKKAAETAKAKTRTELQKAKKCAEYSLLSLRAEGGIFAGLPWFHQRWARDELISVKGIMKTKPKLAKKIIFYWLEKLNSNLPGTLTEKIADSGWVFVRLQDILRKMDSQEKMFALAKIDYFLRKQKIQNRLIINEAKETWMDSIPRQGACIEIQALTLAACKLARKLKKIKKPLKIEKTLKKNVIKEFWNGLYLKDRAGDDTIRPNIFIAAYVYPELLSKKQWITCFDNVLPKLWLNWGGLSTINKNDPRFCKEHTGENPKSYHNGDSWFWINNLTAIVLNKFDKKRYKDYIKQILKASTKEILKMGAIGNHCELSSAKTLKSQGCLVQAWSAATYIELVDEVKKWK